MGCFAVSQSAKSGFSCVIVILIVATNLMMVLFYSVLRGQRNQLFISVQKAVKFYLSKYAR